MSNVIKNIKKSDKFLYFHLTDAVSSSLIEYGLALAEEMKIHIMKDKNFKLPNLIEDSISASKFISVTRRVDFSKLTAEGIYESIKNQLF